MISSSRSTQKTQTENKLTTYSFVRDIDRIASADYLPTNEDILCTYSITPGFYESFFSLKSSRGERNLHVVDNGEGEVIHGVRNADSLFFIAPWPVKSYEDLRTVRYCLYISPHCNLVRAFKLTLLTSHQKQLNDLLSIFKSTLKVSQIKPSRLVLIFQIPENHSSSITLDEMRVRWEDKFGEVAKAMGGRDLTVYDIDVSDKVGTKRSLDDIFEVEAYDLDL